MGRLPSSMDTASTSVAAATAASASIMTFFRFQRSAHTPPNRETASWGRNPQSVERVSIFPEEVVSVMYQIIAYWTMEEPSRDTPWAARNWAARRCQQPDESHMKIFLPIEVKA